MASFILSWKVVEDDRSFCRNMFLKSVVLFLKISVYTSAFRKLPCGTFHSLPLESDAQLVNE